MFFFSSLGLVGLGEVRPTEYIEAMGSPHNYISKIGLLIKPCRRPDKIGGPVKIDEASI